jgi:hypothetical protein
MSKASALTTLPAGLLDALRAVDMVQVHTCRKLSHRIVGWERAFGIRDALRHEFSWTHYRRLLRLSGAQTRQGSINQRIAMKLVACCALLMGATASFHAHADVWSFVDERGVAHFASHPVDARYQLFFRETSILTPDVALPVAIVPKNALPQGRGPLSPATAKIIAYMEAAPGYKAVQQHLRTASDTHKVDFALLQALIATESGFDARARSPKGAIGLMQLMPATAGRYGVASDRTSTVQKKLYDPKTNINAGTRYLRDLLDMFPGRTDLALAAYNAGEAAVQRAGNKIPNYKETQNYVKTVTQIYAGLNPQTVKPAPAATAIARVSYGADATLTMSPQFGVTGRRNMPE